MLFLRELFYIIMKIKRQCNFTVVCIQVQPNVVLNLQNKYVTANILKKLEGFNHLKKMIRAIFLNFG